MKNRITTKDLGSLNELMTFESWMALKLASYAETIEDEKFASQFRSMSKVHKDHHKGLLDYLKSNGN